MHGGVEFAQGLTQECAMAGGEAPYYTPEQAAQIARAERAPGGTDLLISLAGSFWRGGMTAQFADCFRRAYRLTPALQIARSLLGPVTTAAAWRTAQAMSEVLVAHGVAYSTVLADLAGSALQVGDEAAVRRLVDYDRFFRQGVCVPPDGQSIDAFNDAVAAEIKSRRVYYGAPDDRSIRDGYRNNRALEAKSPALAALRTMLQAAVDDYIAALPGDDPAHPFLAMRPAAPVLDGWAVISTPQSHHISHIHPAAWATGVYYVCEPAVARSSRSGWLEVGPPPDAPPGPGWERRHVAPRRGSFVLMPAYFYHATEPMGVDDERICIAFETKYPELADLG
jgi:putative 2-oxoglutarate-Fe(II)-dependent oxygenase superfamily protein